MIPKILRAFWILSMVLFLAALLVLYSFLPPEGLRVIAGEIQSDIYMGQEYYLISHEYFFWGTLSLFIVVNALLYLFYKLLLVTGRAITDVRALLIRQELAAWMLGFAGSLNLFFIFAMSFLVLINRNAQDSEGPYALLVFAGPLIIIAMFAVLGYILLRRRS